MFIPICKRVIVFDSRHKWTRAFPVEVGAWLSWLASGELYLAQAHASICTSGGGRRCAVYLFRLAAIYKHKWDVFILYTKYIDTDPWGKHRSYEAYINLSFCGEIKRKIFLRVFSPEKCNLLQDTWNFVEIVVSDCGLIIYRVFTNPA